MSSDATSLLPPERDPPSSVERIATLIRDFASTRQPSITVNENDRIELRWTFDLQGGVPTPSGVGLEPGGDSLREVHTRGVPTFGGDRGHTGGCGRVSESQAILYPQQKSESVDSSDGRSSAISPPEGIGWQDVETLVGGVCEASTSLNGGLAATRNPLPSGGGGCQNQVISIELDVTGAYRYDRTTEQIVWSFDPEPADPEVTDEARKLVAEIERMVDGNPISDRLDAGWYPSGIVRDESGDDRVVHDRHVLIWVRNYEAMLREAAQLLTGIASDTERPHG
jgi:hypothetical protein